MEDKGIKGILIIGLCFLVIGIYSLVKLVNGINVFTDYSNKDMVSIEDISDKNVNDFVDVNVKYCIGPVGELSNQLDFITLYNEYYYVIVDETEQNAFLIRGDKDLGESFVNGVEPGAFGYTITGRVTEIKSSYRDERGSLQRKCIDKYMTVATSNGFETNINNYIYIDTIAYSRGVLNFIAGILGIFFTISVTVVLVKMSRGTFETYQDLMDYNPTKARIRSAIFVPLALCALLLNIFLWVVS